MPNIYDNIKLDFDAALLKHLKPAKRVDYCTGYFNIRGCSRGCRFCQAGQLYRPIRTKDVNILKDIAEQMIKNSGYEELNLSSLSSSDYPDLKELIDYLIDFCEKNRVNISLPSLRFQIHCSFEYY